MVGQAKKSHGGLAWPSLNTSIWRCRYLCRRTKIRIFKSLVIPVLLYGCETWTLNIDLKRRIDVFGARCLRKIMGCHWYDFVSNQRLFRETDSRPITSIVRQRQLRLLWACGAISGSRSCLSGCFHKGQSDLEEAKGTPTELLAAASRCLLLGVTRYRKGACMETREA